MRAYTTLLHQDSLRRLHPSSQAAYQVLEDAKAVDDAKAAGQDTGPLCGLAFAVKDNIDVLG